MTRFLASRLSQAAVVLVVGDSRSGAVWFGTTMMGFALAPQFPMMLTYLERRIAITGSPIVIPPNQVGLNYNTMHPTMLMPTSV